MTDRQKLSLMRGWDLLISKSLELSFEVPLAAAGPSPFRILDLMKTIQVPLLLTSFDKRKLHVDDRSPAADVRGARLTYLTIDLDDLERLHVNQVSSNTFADFQGFKALERPNIALGQFITYISRPWQSLNTRLIVHSIERCRIEGHEPSINIGQRPGTPLQPSFWRGSLYWSRCTHDSAVLSDSDTKLRNWLSRQLTQKKPAYLVVAFQTYEKRLFKLFRSVDDFNDRESEGVLAICIREVREVRRSHIEGKSSIILGNMKWIQYTGVNAETKERDTSNMSPSR